MSCGRGSGVGRCGGGWGGGYGLFGPPYVLVPTPAEGQQASGVGAGEQAGAASRWPGASAGVGSRWPGTPAAPVSGWPGTQAGPAPQWPGSPVGSRPDSVRVRASDAERERVAEVVSAAVGEGRLTVAEGEQRLTRVYQAVFRDELPGLTVDLPALGEPVVAVSDRHLLPGRGAARGGFAAAGLPVVVVVVAGWLWLAGGAGGWLPLAVVLPAAVLVLTVVVSWRVLGARRRGSAGRASRATGRPHDRARARG